MRMGLVTAMLLLAGCGDREQKPDASADSGAAAQAPSAQGSPAAPGWRLRSDEEGSVLALLPAEGNATMRLFCAAGQKGLLVNVPAFRPTASEERLSFGSGGQAVALVARAGEDPQRGGVSATGPVPAELLTLLGSRLSASYGDQKSGPHPAPMPHLSRAFISACGQGKATAQMPSSPAAKSSPGSTAACMMQGEEPLSSPPLRAIGTEPFWGARIEGRCVTYSHPEDQAGTRIWTRYAKLPDGGSWTGALGGKPFELRTRAKAGCSDGMSDKSYKIAVELVVNGEKRKGCAERL